MSVGRVCDVCKKAFPGAEHTVDLKTLPWNEIDVCGECCKKPLAEILLIAHDGKVRIPK